MTTIPLTPASGGGMCVDTSALEPADVIVSTGAAAVSRVIRTATGSAVSHAMLYAGNGQIVEAIGDGVTRRPLNSALADATLAVAYRRPQLSASQAHAVVSFVGRQVGRKYDSTGAAGAGLRNNLVLCAISGIAACVAAHAGAFESSKKFFCSELVLEAFRSAGLPLVSHSPSVSVPEDIVTAHGSGTLSYVGHLRA